MAFYYKERHAYGKFSSCGCTSEPTSSYCQSQLCAEIDSNGLPINRNAPQEINDDIVRTLQPPFRNGSGYLRPEYGFYDNNNNVSKGHVAPCSIIINIDSMPSQNYCDDCEDMVGAYPAILGVNGYPTEAPLFVDNVQWWTTLCKPSRRSSACGAAFANAYMDFGTGNFNFLATGVRDVYLNVSIYTQEITPLLTVNQTGDGLILQQLFYGGGNGFAFCQDTCLAGCFEHGAIGANTYNRLVSKRAKVGTINWNPPPTTVFTLLGQGAGYFNSTVQCNEWNNVTLNETVFTRDLCNGNSAVIKVSSMPNTFHSHFRTDSPSWQFNNGSVPKYPTVCYNLCFESPANSSHIGGSSAECGQPGVTNQHDSFWPVSRKFYTEPEAYIVNIIGATGDCSNLNGNNLLTRKFRMGGNPSTSDFEYGFKAFKNFDRFDSPPTPASSVGYYYSMGCNQCAGFKNGVCLDYITLTNIYDNSIVLNNPTGTVTFEIHGQSDYNLNTTLLARYTGTYTGNTGGPYWFNNPVTLNYVTGLTISPNHYQCELSGLTVSASIPFSRSSLETNFCMSPPRSPICRGGKVPDAFSVSIPNGWQPGYAAGKNYVTSSATCATGCVDEIFVNCANFPWAGPVGDYLLTKGPYTGATGINCAENHTCNTSASTNTTVSYHYINGNGNQLCNWKAISMHFGSDILNRAPCSSYAMSLVVYFSESSSSGFGGAGGDCRANDCGCINACWTSLGSVDCNFTFSGIALSFNAFLNHDGTAKGPDGVTEALRYMHCEDLTATLVPSGGNLKLMTKDCNPCSDDPLPLKMHPQWGGGNITAEAVYF